MGLFLNVISFANLNVKIYRLYKTQNYGHQLHSLGLLGSDAYKNALSYHLDFNVFNYFVSNALPVELNWQCQCNKGCVCMSE